MPTNREALISQRAYEIWEREARPHGRDRQHWAQAERELAGAAAAAKPARARKAAGKPAAAVTPVRRGKAK